MISTNKIDTMKVAASFLFVFFVVALITPTVVSQEQQPPEPFGPFFMEYYKNEARADLQYLGKVVTLSGRINGIRKDDGGTKYYVEIVDKDFNKFQGFGTCYFADPKKIAHLERNQDVVICGTCAGLRDRKVILTDCQLIENKDKK
jgi:hypothetical protein